MYKSLKKVWRSWAITEHHSDTEFCQATDTADFQLECFKMFLLRTKFPSRSRVFVYRERQKYTQDCLQFTRLSHPICSCGNEFETTVHYLLHSLNYLHQRRTLLDNVKSVLPYILEQNDIFSSDALLFANTSLDDS